MMKITSRIRSAREYVTAKGKTPFGEWLKKLKDRKGRAVILRRISQAEEGNFGSYRDVGDGIFELKISLGPGYRVYFGLEGETIILLLCGGDKGTQRRDIEKAKGYWKDYKEND